MSLYGEAIAAIKSIILIDERVQSVAKKLDRLAEEVRDIKDRLIQLGNRYRNNPLGWRSAEDRPETRLWIG